MNKAGWIVLGVILLLVSIGYCAEKIGGGDAEREGQLDEAGATTQCRLESAGEGDVRGLVESKKLDARRYEVVYSRSMPIRFGEPDVLFQYRCVYDAETRQANITSRTRVGYYRP